MSDRRWPLNMNKTQIPLEQWQSEQQYQQQRLPQIYYTPQQLQQILQMQRQQQRLAAEVTDLRKPNTYNNNNNNINYNNIPPPLQQQPLQLPTKLNTRQPKPENPYYYNNYNNIRVQQAQGQIPRQLPRNLSYAQHSIGTNNSGAEQFETFDPSQRNARTFGFISDFISSLTSSCVNPCTIEAYTQNRCCVVVVKPEPPICCQQPVAPPQPPIIPPQLPPMLPPLPPISCCSACSYGYFGPPPCGYYGGSGVFRRGGGLFGSGGFLGGNPGILYNGGSLGNLGYGALGGGQFSLSVPQPSMFG